MQRTDIIQGFRIGIPIALGYFAVAFSLGIIAKQAGLTAAIGFVSSFFTRASAGEYGVYTLVAAQATYVEIVAMCLVVNLRYMLMSAALSQKIAPGTSWIHRVLMACCVTDEIFGVSISRLGYCPPAYTYSAALISTLFWAAGCAAGIVAGGMLPVNIVAALSVALYGMFIAIIMPPARDDRHVLYAVIASFVLSGACSIAPVVSSWSSGTRTIVLTVLISAVAAWLVDQRSDQQPIPAQFPLLRALRHTRRHDLPQHDPDHPHAPVRYHRPGHRHHRSLAPSGTFPRRRHLLRHRLSDRYPDTLITTHSNPIPPTLSQIPLPV